MTKFRITYYRTYGINETIEVQADATSNVIAWFELEMARKHGYVIVSVEPAYKNPVKDIPFPDWMFR